MSHEEMKNKIILSMLFFSLSGIILSSSYTIDSQLQFNAFAQTPDDSAGPVPEDNSTDMLGPVPEDNSTGVGSSDNTSDLTSSDNLTQNSPGDLSSVNPLGNETMPANNMYSQQENTYPQSANNTAPSNMTMTQHNVLPPLKQLKSGVSAKDVQCKQGFTLIIKAEDGSPGCVTPQVAQILIQRGW